MQAARSRGILARSLIRVFNNGVESSLTKPNSWPRFCGSAVPPEHNGPPREESEVAPPESAAAPSESGDVGSTTSSPVEGLGGPTPTANPLAMLENAKDAPEKKIPLYLQGLGSESEHEIEPSGHETVASMKQGTSDLPDDADSTSQSQQAPVQSVPDGPPPPEYEGESESLREVRLSNASMWGLKGQVISGEVIAVGKDYVVVDLGYKSLSRFFKKELSTSQVYEAAEGHKLKRAEGLFFKHDQLRFRVEDVESPYGDMHLTTYKLEETIRKDLIWKELAEALLNNLPVQGRVLNVVDRGYAVGIGGYVCFCPLNSILPGSGQKIGILQTFKITRMIEKTKSISVMSLEVPTKGLGGRGPFTKSLM